MNLTDLALDVLLTVVYGWGMLLFSSVLLENWMSYEMSLLMLLSVLALLSLHVAIQMTVRYSFVPKLLLPLVLLFYFDPHRLLWHALGLVSRYTLT